MKKHLTRVLSLLLAVALLLPLFAGTAAPTALATSGGAVMFKSVIAGISRTAAIANNGDLYVWGSNYYGQVGNGTTNEQITPIKVLSNVSSVALGIQHSAAITTDGSLYVWGSNIYGQVGNGTMDDQKVPIKVLSNVSSVALGLFHSAAVTTDGSLYVWGNNSHGQVGNGTTNDQITPVKVLSNVSYIAVGYEHTAAITTNGDLYVWGFNHFGQVGNETTTDQEIPVKVLSNVSSVSLGSYLSAAITTDGSLYVWGDNFYGKVGNGTMDDQKVPIKVLSNVSSVALGFFHSAAVTTDGSLYVWGDNSSGQVGNGAVADQKVSPVKQPVKILDSISSITLGAEHSAAITEDRSLYTWGDNNYGQVGNGTTEDRNTPAKMLSNVSSISFGNFHSAAITSDGSLYVWGYNANGQVGNGTTEDQLTPYQIVILSESGHTMDSCFQLPKDANCFRHISLTCEFSDIKYYWNRLKKSGFIFGRMREALEQYGKSTGYCHGLAVSMCLANQGRLNLNSITEGASSYWELGSPYTGKEVTNPKFRDLLMYYYLTQFTNSGDRTKIVSSINGFQLTPIEQRLKSFLSSFVTEAQRAQKEERPFVFAYSYYEYGTNTVGGGHSVVVCGYQWDSQRRQHVILIYDENCIDLLNNAPEFYTMTVSEDFSHFEYSDHHSRQLENQGYTACGVGDLWCELKYYGIDTIYNSIEVVDPANTVQAMTSGNNHTEVYITANASFTLKNAEGAYLRHDENGFSGTMAMYDCHLSCAGDNPSWVIETDVSNTFALTNASDNCSIALTLDRKNYAVSCTNADTVTIGQNGISVEGTNTTYSVSMTPDIQTVDMIQLSGKCSGNSSFSYNDDSTQIHVSSDHVMEDISAAQFCSLEKDENQIQNAKEYYVIASTEEAGAAVLVNGKEVPISKEPVNPFTDVPENQYYYEPVLWAVENNITNGITKTTFGPGQNCTRAQVVTFLWRANGCP
ncbi:MAG: S-layer homology domain-containing protein, partial [Faecousia sp.]